MSAYPLSGKARTALAKAYATRGKHKGQLLAKCPPSGTLAAAAWQGAMRAVNPFKVSISAMLFMTDEQRAICDEIATHFDRLPHAYKILAQRDRAALESLGVW